MIDDVTGLALLPLDEEMLRCRLEAEDFCLEREVDGAIRKLHFGPEFPGAALVLYRRFLGLVSSDGVVEGTHVIADLQQGEVVGQLGTMGPPTGETVEIGYGVNSSACGRGIATWAVGAVLDDLGSRADLGRVVARTAASNPASGRVLEKNGFELTGREASDEGELLVWEHRG